MNARRRLQRTRRAEHHAIGTAIARWLFAPVLSRYHASVLLAKHPARIFPALKTWTFHNIFSSLTVLTILWFWTLSWGEVMSFDQSIDACSWDAWENWPAEAIPHRLLFVADPQLIDPHTYPGRPWPLSTLTIKHTDLYLTRAFSRMQRNLQPHTTMFLGDLFDGGREWSTHGTVSLEEQWRKYGENFWLGEFTRFGKIFLRNWRDPNQRGDVGPGHQVIATLPGNHDLGFGEGIQIGVRKRFEAFFGVGNRIDIIGNHTFVSIDGVSLSAKDQESAKSMSDIWRPTEDFLKQAHDNKLEIIQHHFDQINKASNHKRHDHTAVDVIYTNHERRAVKSSKPAPQIEADFPTILLTHVPLSRAPGTPCGPLRERWPPTPPPPGQTEPVMPDEDNAIKLNRGVQYQNTLTRVTSQYVMEKLEGLVEYAFSGDDHDYCEVVHHQYPSKAAGIREITVKSISWAMGVRHPGVVLVSMWNPVNEQGKSLRKSSNSPAAAQQATLQTHLCLLPDQLSIFIRYGILAGTSFIFLLVRSIFIVFASSKSGKWTAQSSNSTLPLFASAHSPYSSSAEQEKESVPLQSLMPNHMSPEDDPQPTYHSARDAATARTRNMPKTPDGHHAESNESLGSSPPVNRDHVSRNRFVAMLGIWAGSVWTVMWKVLLWYLWLLKH